MFENYTLITAAFVLPLFGVYFFLLTRLVSSTSDEQRQLLTGPRWMAAVTHTDGDRRALRVRQDRESARPLARGGRRRSALERRLAPPPSALASTGGQSEFAFETQPAKFTCGIEHCTERHRLRLEWDLSPCCRAGESAEI